MLVLLLACAPEPGTYLMETTAWSTTCSLGGGSFEEPAAQYLVEVYVENETELWLDDNACTRDELAYTCADEPITAELAGAGAWSITRAWSGAWSDAKHLDGEVVWTTNCTGSGCEDVESCDAAWAYEAVNVDDVMGAPGG